jgi:protein-ribulosamine 3-kinase
VTPALPGWQLEPLAASGFCDTWRATRGHDRLFVKTGRADLLAAEANGLRALADTRTIRVPAVVHTAQGVLAMEWLDLVAPDVGFGKRLAQALRQLHAHDAGPLFGWPRDNFIGATAQTNSQNRDWLAFHADQRLRAMTARLAHEQLQEVIESVIDVMPLLFDDGYQPRPALIHGDLWPGNWGMLAGGTPVIYDPAVSVSDPEAELAMMELFGSLPAGFMQAYPVPEGYARRRPLYQLYHLLNHAVLFGGSYLASALACARGIAKR